MIGERAESAEASCASLGMAAKWPHMARRIRSRAQRHPNEPSHAPRPDEPADVQTSYPIGRSHIVAGGRRMCLNRPDAVLCGRAHAPSARTPAVRRRNEPQPLHASDGRCAPCSLGSTRTNPTVCLLPNEPARVLQTIAAMVDGAGPIWRTSERTREPAFSERTRRTRSLSAGPWRLLTLAAS